MRGDWKDDAMQYRDIDRAAQEKAEEELAEQEIIRTEQRVEKSYQDAITGANPLATARLIKALRKAWKMEK
jgi:hypothetical protein